jgi:hypothetical protein
MFTSWSFKCQQYLSFLLLLVHLPLLALLLLPLLVWVLLALWPLQLSELALLLVVLPQSKAVI